MRRFDPAEYRATVASAHNTLPSAVEMEKLFGNVDHFITHYGFDSEPKTWNSEVSFGGRYTLTMQVQVSINYESHTVTPIDEPKFWLLEVDKIQKLPNGNYQASFNRQLEFSLPEWHKLYESKGDLTVLGVLPNATAVRMFDEYVAAGRHPRIPVSLLPHTPEKVQ